MLIPRHGGVVGEIARAEQAFLLARVPHEEDRALRFPRQGRDLLGDLQRRHRARAVVVGAVVHRVGPIGRGVLDPERRERRVDLGLLLGGGLSAGVVGALGPHHVVPEANRVVVDRRVAEPQVVVVRPDGDVFGAELGIAAADDPEDVARGIAQGLHAEPQVECHGDAAGSGRELGERCGEQLLRRGSTDQQERRPERALSLVEKGAWPSQRLEEGRGQAVEPGERDRRGARHRPQTAKQAAPAQAAAYAQDDQLAAGLLGADGRRGVAGLAPIHDRQRAVLHPARAERHVVAPRP